MIGTIILIFLWFLSLLSIITGGICCIFLRKKARRIMTLAPGLETFLKIMIPLWFSMPLGLAVSTMYALLGRDIYTRMPNFIISFLILSCQIIDLTALTVSIDCAVASLTKTQDPFLREKFHGYIMSICCIVISICIGLAFHFYTINFADILSIFSMVIHIVCFLTEVILLIMNIRRHKIVPFDYELSIRHKLVRNIKMLRLLCPFLFITTILSTFGPTVVHRFVASNAISLPTGVQLIFSCYNASLLFAIFIFMWKCYKQVRNSKVVHIDSNQKSGIDHFQQLKALWR